MKKIKVIISSLLAALMMITNMSIAASAKTIHAFLVDTEYCDFSLAKDISLNQTTDGTLDAGELIFYKFKSNFSGILVIDYSVNDNNVLRFFDSDETNQTIYSSTIKDGSAMGGSGKGDYQIWGNIKDDKMTFSASVGYKVKKGENYCISIWNSRAPGNFKGDGKYTIKISEKGSTSSDKQTSKTDTKDIYFGITLSKGSKFQLQAVNADAKNTTWTSSKKSVATVSSTGKITAKKAGTTTITCKCGDVIVKLKVTVK